MDSDGVVGAMKSVRDEIAAWLGVDDRHDNLVEYRYGQEKTKTNRVTDPVTGEVSRRSEFGVRIEVSPRGAS
jgi:hypothetical protein